MTVKQALTRLAEGHLQEALIFFQMEKWRNPCYGSLVNLAVAERANALFQEARSHFREAAIMERNRPEAWAGLGNLALDLGEFAEATECFGTAATVCHLRQIATPSPIALGLATCLMRLRNFNSAWPLWEYGRQNQSWHCVPGTQPWNGQEAGCLTVVCEGGFGDAFLFARWLPLAKQKCRVLKLIIWDQLVDFRDWYALGVDEVIAYSQPFSNEGMQYTTSWMSLPARLGMKSLIDIPYDTSLFGCIPPEERNGIGFCWRAEENMQIRKTRSIPTKEAEKLIDALKNTGEPVYSLVPKGQGLYKEVDDLDWPSNMIQNEGVLAGWRVTMAFIKTLKFVVSVDTAVAHLAGLCGIPVVLLLPLNSDWKWFTKGVNCPWYPGFTYVRNDHPSDWHVEIINMDKQRGEQNEGIRS